MPPITSPSLPCDNLRVLGVWESFYYNLNIMALVCYAVNVAGSP